MPLPPAIDYTSKDYASLRRSLIELARFRMPEWTDLSPADPGVVLIDLFCYMADIILYYQDRLASELFPHTALEPRNVLHLLRLMGYELKPPTAASTALSLTFSAPAAGQPTTVTVPQGARFATKPGAAAAQTFEYTLPNLTIDLAGSQVETDSKGMRVYQGLSVRQCQSQPEETLGVSTGEPNQRFELKRSPVLLDTLEVEVNEGAGFVKWDLRDNLLYGPGPDGRTVMATKDSRSYTVQFDEHGTASVVFGDNEFCAIPRGTIRARYRSGGGAAGNVGAGTITEIRTNIPGLKSVTNPSPAVGGEDRESIEHAVRFAPQAFRSQNRAVTLSDFISLAHQAGGVAKVRAYSKGWNQVELVVAPSGEVAAASSNTLKQRLVQFFEDRRMVGTFVVVRDPVLVPVDVSLEVVPEYNYDPEAVRLSVEAAINELLAYENVDFGRPLYLSKIYEAVEAIPGVFAATVTRFARVVPKGRPEDTPLRRRQALKTPNPSLQAMIGGAGRIDLNDREIPFLGAFVIEMKEASR